MRVSWSALAKRVLQFWSRAASDTPEPAPPDPEPKPLLAEGLSTNTEVEQRGYTEGVRAFLSEGFRLGLFYKVGIGCKTPLPGERFFVIHLTVDDIWMPPNAKNVRRAIEFAYQYAEDPDYGVHLVILGSPTPTAALEAFDAGRVEHVWWDTGKLGDDPKTTLADWLESQGESPTFPDLPAEYWMTPFPAPGN